METLLSPVLAALALTFMSFNWLCVGTAIGFVASALLETCVLRDDRSGTGGGQSLRATSQHRQRHRAAHH